MQARLIVLHDKANVKHVKLLPVTLIGRSTECNLKIASSQVSRTHCRITLSKDTVLVEDLGSANGTIVDGQPLPPNQKTSVSPGATLVIGPATFQVDYVAPTSPTIVLTHSQHHSTDDSSSTELLHPQKDVEAGIETIVAEVNPASAPAADVKSKQAPSEKSTKAKPSAPKSSSVGATATLANSTTESQPSTIPQPDQTAVLFEDSPLGITSSEAAPHLDPNASEETLTMFGEAEPDAGQDSESPFSFGDESTIPVRSDKKTEAGQSNSGGMKSLFSLFGKKNKTPEPTKDVSTESGDATVFLPTADESPFAAETPVGAVPSNELVEPGLFEPAATHDPEADEVTIAFDSTPTETEKPAISDDDVTAFLKQL